jgi:hypothetical protein
MRFPQSRQANDLAELPLPTCKKNLRGPGNTDGSVSSAERTCTERSQSRGSDLRSLLAARVRACGEIGGGSKWSKCASPLFQEAAFRRQGDSYEFLPRNSAAPFLVTQLRCPAQTGAANEANPWRAAGLDALPPRSMVARVTTGLPPSGCSGGNVPLTSTSNLKRPPGDTDPSNLEATARDEAWKSLFRKENASKGLVRHVADKAQSAETNDSKAHTHHRWCGAGGSPRTLFVLTSTWVAPRPLPGASSSRLFNRLLRHRLPPHHGALACSGWRVSPGHSPTWKARQNE